MSISFYARFDQKTLLLINPSDFSSPFSSGSVMAVLLQHGTPAHIEILQHWVLWLQSGFGQGDGLPVD